MENDPEEKTDDDFDSRRQASFVYRAFALFCCVLFLIWTARFRGDDETSKLRPVGDLTQTRVVDDERAADSSATSLEEIGKSSDVSSNVAPPKLVLLIDLNAATKAELTNLPGIGETLAGRVVEYRESVGGFSEVEQLLEVKGIGPKKFAAIRPFCAVGSEEETEP